MRIAICDNDMNFSDYMKKVINHWASDKGVKVNIVEYTTAEKFLFHWSPREEFDLIFLDILMDNMTGMELASIIRKIDQNVSIVFVSGSREYVFDGYNVGALNYLLKPVSVEACRKCLDTVHEKNTHIDDRCLLISKRTTTKKIPYDEIYYMESFSHYIIIHTVAGEEKCKKNIKDLEDELPQDCFVRTHRSYIVNIRFIETIDKTSLTLENKVEIPVSRNQWQVTNNAFIMHHSMAK